jgi:hypothetical protein
MIAIEQESVTQQEMARDEKLSARRVHFAFPENVDASWCNGSPFKSQWLNAYTLISPEGEKFVHRALRDFAMKVEAPLLRRQLAGLFAQEMSHSVEHARFWEPMRAQGFSIDGFIRLTSFISYKLTEPLLSDELRLATAAGVEHINAFIAEVGLEGDLLEGAEPSLRELFEWHYAEEIEHKSVAYDLLQAVAPGRALRIAGLGLAAMNFVVDLSLGTAWLLAQQGKLLSWPVLREGFTFFWTRERFMPRLLAACVQYCAKGFHPKQVPNDHLAARVLARYATGAGR